jgi:hypothetical protein
MTVSRGTKYGAAGVSDAMDKLERYKLAERLKDGKDKRKRWVSITPAGLLPPGQDFGATDEPVKADAWRNLIFSKDSSTHLCNPIYPTEQAARDDAEPTLAYIKSLPGDMTGNGRKSPTYRIACKSRRNHDRSNHHRGNPCRRLPLAPWRRCPGLVKNRNIYHYQNEWAGVRDAQQGVFLIFAAVPGLQG